MRTRVRLRSHLSRTAPGYVGVVTVDDRSVVLGVVAAVTIVVIVVATPVTRTVIVIVAATAVTRTVVVIVVATAVTRTVIVIVVATAVTRTVIVIVVDAVVIAPVIAVVVIIIVADAVVIAPVIAVVVTGIVAERIVVPVTTAVVGPHGPVIVTRRLIVIVALADPLPRRAVLDLDLHVDAAGAVGEDDLDLGPAGLLDLSRPPGGRVDGGDRQHVGEPVLDAARRSRGDQAALA
jgi:hypothetical protein